MPQDPRDQHLTDRLGQAAAEAGVFAAWLRGQSPSQHFASLECESGERGEFLRALLADWSARWYEPVDEWYARHYGPESREVA